MPTRRNQPDNEQPKPAPTETSDHPNPADQSHYVFEMKFGIKKVSPRSRNYYEKRILPKKGELKTMYNLNDIGFEEPLPFVSAFPKPPPPAKPAKPSKGKKK
uniref:Uncharacterized protein n=1 Tax=Cacopsylla melanoneura TaxID=428564 RepID=A0A8D8ZMV2_9HEMI